MTVRYKRLSLCSLSLLQEFSFLGSPTTPFPLCSTATAALSLFLSSCSASRILLYTGKISFPGRMEPLEGFFALHQDKARHFHPAIDERIMACEAMGISIHTFFLSASSSGCYFSSRCTLLATNFSPPPFTTTLLMQHPSIELLVLSRKVAQTF